MARTHDEEAEASAVDPHFAQVIAAFAKDPQVGRRRMFGSSAVLNVNGKIFAMLVKGKFVAKLPRERVDALVRSGKGEYFDPGHGRLMKEWVAVAAGTTPWVELAKEAHGFVKAGQSQRRPSTQPSDSRRGPVNTEWHGRHAMAKNATLDERIAWHREHQRRCACRPVPPTLMAQMRSRSSAPGKTKASRRRAKH